MTVKLPVFEIVTACEASTPFVNAAVVPEPEESVPVDVMLTVLPAPVKLVTVLLLASRAVMRTLKLEPAVWVPIAPPPAASTRKLLRAPGLTVKAALFPEGSMSPLVRVAVSTTPDSAVVYVTPLMVVELDPALIVPVSVPPSVPVPAPSDREAPVAATALIVRPN